jgi:flagellar basal body-associated protein FliL
MTNLNEAALATAEKRGRSVIFRSWKIVAVLLVAVSASAGGAGYWYLIPRPSVQPAKDHVVEPPFYLEMKPFVVSIASGYGTTHFVELGLNLALLGKDAGNTVTGVLPEVQDTIRQTVLAFKMEDIVTPAGVDRLREAIIASANRLLLQRLGADEVKRLTGGKRSGGMVQNIYFSTLIVE